MIQGGGYGWTFTLLFQYHGHAGVTGAARGIILGFSSILTGLNFIVTGIPCARPPELDEAALFVWGIYGTSIIRCWRRR